MPSVGSVKDPAVKLAGADQTLFRSAYRASMAEGVARRLHLTVALFLVFVGVSVLLEITHHPRRLPVALWFYSLETGACLLALLLCRVARLGPWLHVMGAALAALLAALMTAYAVSAGAHVERIATAQVCLLSGVLVLMPWGWRAQLVVAAATLASLIFSLRVLPMDEAFSYSLLALATAGTTSVAGAFFLDRYRFAAFARAELLSQEAAVRAAFIHSSLDAFVAMDASGRVLEFNPAAEEMFGHRRGDVLGGDMAELLVPPDLRARHRAGLQRVLASGKRRVLGERFETRALRADGSEIPVELAITRLVRDGAPLFSGYLRDLSERKRAEQQQAASYRLLDTMRRVQQLFLEDADAARLFDELLAQVLAVTRSEYGFIVELIDRCVGEPGLRRLAATRLTWNEPSRESYRREQADDLDAGELAALCRPVITSGKAVIDGTAGAESRPDPTHFRSLPNAFLGLPLYHAGGELVGVVGLANRAEGYDEAVVEYLRPVLATCSAIIKAHRSNVERRQAQEALAASKRRIEEEAEIAATLLQVGQVLNMHLGQPDLLECAIRVVVEALECDGSSIYVWDEHAEGFRLAADVGTDLAVLAEVASVCFTRENLPLVAALRPGVVIEVSCADEQTLVPMWLMERWQLGSLLVVPITRGDRIVGTFVHGYHSATPFTPRQRRIAIGVAHATALALENARLIADLQAANRLKTEFVSTMSHELRTPLNVILGFSGIARDPNLSPAEREDYLTRIETSGRELLGLIEDTLEIAKIEEGRDQVELRQVDFPTFWAELGEACARMPRKESVAFDWREPAGTGVLLVDPRKLTVVIRNLVGNACKFTERGWVRVEAMRCDQTLILRVSDTGIGIRPQDQKIIFEMFRQADGSDSRRYGGAGLGLYIIRSYVQQMGGTIDLDSDPQRGSVFTVSIPCTLLANDCDAAA
jgi:PAS domain S-box-containing protein